MRAGEILGIAGVAGNGQNELLLALERRDARSADADAIRLDGKPLGALGDRRAAAPRPRAPCPRSATATRAVPGFSLADNAVLTARDRKAMVRHGRDQRRRPRAATPRR